MPTRMICKILLFMEMALDQYQDTYNALQKMFVLMPYQHSENIEDQKKGVETLTEIIADRKKI